MSPNVVNNLLLMLIIYYIFIISIKTNGKNKRKYNKI